MEPPSKSLCTERIFTIHEMSGVNTIVSVPSYVTVKELKEQVLKARKFNDINWFRLYYKNAQLPKDMPLGDIEGYGLFLIFRPAGDNY